MKYVILIFNNYQESSYRKCCRQHTVLYIIVPLDITFLVYLLCSIFITNTFRVLYIISTAFQQFSMFH